MSLLGPDDFDLSGKDRKKKLAKDLSPSVAKEIERWLEREDDSEAFRKVSELVGPEEATRLFAKRRKDGRKLSPRDTLLED
jgi:chromatin segregation and condensation protein Rec8/ScpA/Scc1 (kleisin family)